MTGPESSSEASPNLRAVTFDCWGTLIFQPTPDEPPNSSRPASRERVLIDLLTRHGVRHDEETARQALRKGSQRHWRCWQDGIATGASDIVRWTFEDLEIDHPELQRETTSVLEERALEFEVRALDGARDTLQRMADLGIRRGLICDTGYSPGRVVRQLLDRVGLLDLLEVTIFSDEAGFPKPNASLFHSALGALEVAPEHAAHVGDLRRTDIAGARGVGMRSVRIRDVNDDDVDLQDADHIADNHPHLCELLGF